MTALLISNVVLWAVVLALIAVLLALTRQVGVLHERIAPAGALMINRGPAVGEPVAPLEVTDLAGQMLQIGAPSADGRSTLLVFVSPTCPVCKTLLPVLRASHVQERDWLRVVLASDGEPQEHRRFVQQQGLSDVPYVVSAQLGLGYQVNRLPFAALVDQGGVLRARGLVNSREHLESLFEAQRLGMASLQEYFASRA
ncbi:MAG TPA: methylamine dehydrogenase accessory protein MauD [Steroidobacteraceae bacterium]|nr:methylamine dehydrogenase accessory protein MauD [Steroidobacteraceae bacterium]